MYKKRYCTYIRNEFYVIASTTECCVVKRMIDWRLHYKRMSSNIIATLFFSQQLFSKCYTRHRHSNMCACVCFRSFVFKYVVNTKRQHGHVKLSWWRSCLYGVMLDVKPPSLWNTLISFFASSFVQHSFIHQKQLIIISMQFRLLFTSIRIRLFIVCRCLEF